MPRSSNAPGVARRSEPAYFRLRPRDIRTSTKLLLEAFRFEVLVAADGVEAIEVASAHARRITAVHLDLTMPRVDGIETMKELRRIAPGCRSC